MKVYVHGTTHDKTKHEIYMIVLILLLDVMTSFKGYIYYVILHLSKFSHKT